MSVCVCVCDAPLPPTGSHLPLQSVCHLTAIAFEKERESTLEDKEKSILDLRRKNMTLDNFRFVLDHRVTQLMDERGPITEHIKGLEGHIDAMYDELER